MSSVTGTRVLLRSFLRRDRWLLLWWTLGVTLLYWSQAISVDRLYTTQAEFDRAAETMGANGAFVAMAGPARALNTVGGQVTWQATAFGAIAVGLMSMFIVGRHTRAEEESGRDELVRASAVGRHAPATAALLAATVANLLVAALVTASLVDYGLAFADSLALGVGLALVGGFFAGTALLAAQLTSSTRVMYGLAGALIGTTYALRAIGDVGRPALSWLSPIGWYQAMRPFSGLRWWPAMLLVGATVVVVVVAFALFRRRDVGAGLLAARPGPARGGAGLRGALGLAWRLQRGSVLGWACGLLLVGLAYGSIGDEVGDMVGDSAAGRDLIGQGSADLVAGFYATTVLAVALLSTGFAISSTLRPRAEESAGHVEALLATPLSRQRWLASQVLVTVAGTVLVLVAGGLGLGVGNALVTGDAGAVLRLGAPTLAHAAPILLVAGVGRLLYGVRPAVLVATWLLLVWALVVMMFGPLLGIPQWLQVLSPFEHLALVPAEPFRWTPFLVLAGLATLVTLAGQFAFSRRDIG